ncbi:MAG TPA: hypothetical protein VIM86_14235 [Thermodesulfobacteriota bacterium]
MARQIRLTPALQESVCNLIRKGAYPHAAAAACGVPEAVFQGWLRRGGDPRAGKTYRELTRCVNEATGAARVLAEARVYAEDPKFWLRSGPGRERPGAPGWTTTARPYPAGHDHVNPLEDPACARLLATVLDVLSDFPDVRQAAAEKVDRSDPIAKK